MIKDKQLTALEKAKSFIKSQNIDNPNLTGQIWTILNDNNKQEQISSVESTEFSENWSQELVGKLQRVLVNYQLHQMKLNNPPIVFSMIKDVFNKVEKDLSVLDIGCTSGYYYEILDYYYPNKFKYIGCDYNIESINLAKQYYPNIDFKTEDITKLNFADKSFDITFLSGVIEHVPNYNKGLDELCRITKKYIILHRLWLSDNETICRKGTQYFVPVIRNHYNKNEFIDKLYKNNFMVLWESNVYDGNCKTYLFQNLDFEFKFSLI